MNSNYLDKEFKNKYLKYKQKYLGLKSLIGGVSVGDIIHDPRDGSYLGKVFAITPQYITIKKKVPGEPESNRSFFRIDEGKKWVVKASQTAPGGPAFRGELVGKVFPQMAAKKKELEDKEEAVRNIRTAFQAAKDREAASRASLTADERLRNEREGYRLLEDLRKREEEKAALEAQVAKLEAQGESDSEGELPYFEDVLERTLFSAKARPQVVGQNYFQAAREGSQGATAAAAAAAVPAVEESPAIIRKRDTLKAVTSRLESRIASLADFNGRMKASAKLFDSLKPNEKTKIVALRRESEMASEQMNLNAYVQNLKSAEEDYATLKKELRELLAKQPGYSVIMAAEAERQRRYSSKPVPAEGEGESEFIKVLRSRVENAARNLESLAADIASLQRTRKSINAILDSIVGDSYELELKRQRIQQEIRYTKSEILRKSEEYDRTQVIYTELRSLLDEKLAGQQPQGFSAAMAAEAERQRRQREAAAAEAAEATFATATAAEVSEGAEGADPAFRERSRAFEAALLARRAEERQGKQESQGSQRVSPEVIIEKMAPLLTQISSRHQDIYRTLELTKTCSAIIFFRDYDDYEIFCQLFRIEPESENAENVNSSKFQSKLPQLREEIGSLQSLTSMRVYEIKINIRRSVGIIYFSNYEEYMSVFKSLVEAEFLEEGTTPLSKF